MEHRFNVEIINYNKNFKNIFALLLSRVLTYQLNRMHFKYINVQKK